VGDLGEVQQPGQADDLDGDVTGDEGALDLGEVGGRAAQDRDLSGGGAGADEVGEGVGDPVDLLGVGGQQRAAHGAVVLGAGGRPEGFDAGVHRPQGCGQSVGEVEQAAAAAAAACSTSPTDWPQIGRAHVLGEVVEVGDGGAAPAVDRLA